MGQQETGHSLSLEGRQKLRMSGVGEVISFDENSVVLGTALGTLVVHGQQLQLKNLSVEGGDVAVEGQISALIYEESRKTGGWLRRLLG